MATKKFQIVFTIDGNSVGDPILPPYEHTKPVNDVHFEFTPGKEKPKMQFTQDGDPLDKPKEAPDGANDVGIEFGEDEKGRPRIKWMHWTKKGEPIGFEWAPPRTNDFHLILGKGGLITKAYWTYNGESLEHGGSIKIPNYPVNDAHIEPIKKQLGSADLDYEKLTSALLKMLGEFASYDPIPLISLTSKIPIVYPALYTRINALECGVPDLAFGLAGDNVESCEDDNSSLEETLKREALKGARSWAQRKCAQYAPPNCRVTYEISHHYFPALCIPGNAEEGIPSKLYIAAILYYKCVSGEK